MREQDEGRGLFLTVSVTFGVMGAFGLITLIIGDGDSLAWYLTAIVVALKIAFWMSFSVFVFFTCWWVLSLFGYSPWS